jgi:hypothetical protein
MDKIIDFLTYNSYKAQIELYGLSCEQLRKIFYKWEELEEQYKKEKVNV